MPRPRRGGGSTTVLHCQEHSGRCRLTNTSVVPAGAARSGRRGRAEGQDHLVVKPADGPGPFCYSPPDHTPMETAVVSE